MSDNEAALVDLAVAVASVLDIVTRVEAVAGSRPDHPSQATTRSQLFQLAERMATALGAPGVFPFAFAEEHVPNAEVAALHDELARLFVGKAIAAGRIVPRDAVGDA